MANSVALKPNNEKGGGLADSNLFHLALIIIFGIFATTLPQPQVMGKLPLQHLLKDGLHVSKTEMSTFFFWCGLFWYLKPFAGVLTDAFPLFKTRRRWYLLISSVLAGASWILLGLPALKMSGAANLSNQVIPYTYRSLLIGCIVINLFMVMMSTVVGAFLVEAGQSLNATGRLTSVRQLVSNLCTFLNGPLSGWMASGLFFRAAGVNALIVLSIFPIAYVFLRERPQAVLNADAFTNAGKQLNTIFHSPSLWFALLFVALFYFSPGFNTPLYYRQNDELHFTQQQIGNLGAWSGGFGMLAAVLYAAVIRRFSIRTVLLIGIVTAAGGTLFYLFYNNLFEATLVESQNGFFFGFAEVALIDLAARATPKGCEGLGYSLILSIRNIALFGADIVGSKLSDAKWPFAWLVFLNAATTAIVLILIPFMPKVLMSRRDGDTPSSTDTPPVIMSTPQGRGNIEE
jgi:MFS family permease